MNCVWIAFESKEMLINWFLPSMIPFCFVKFLKQKHMVKTHMHIHMNVVIKKGWNMYIICLSVSVQDNLYKRNKKTSYLVMRNKQITCVKSKYYLPRIKSFSRSSSAVRIKQNYSWKNSQNTKEKGANIETLLNKVFCFEIMSLEI